ncbi:coiled-coil domain-containing protein [Helicobacter pylori]
MDLKGLENALNNGDFKEQVTSSLEGIYQISKLINQLDLLKNFSDHDLEIVGKIQSIKNALERYGTSEQELKAKIDALVNSLEARKQELEAQLNSELESARTSEIQKLNEAGSELKNNLIKELTQAKNNLAQELESLKDAALALKPQIQGVTKFLGVYVYGRQTLFKNESNDFAELFEFGSISLQANKTYIVQFSMPFELLTNGLYSESMGEILLGLKANDSVYPILISFYQFKTANLKDNKIIDTYEVNCVFETPKEKADYKIAVFARKHKDLWVNVNYTPNTQGFETSFLNKAIFRDSTTTKIIPTKYNNDWVFYKHSQALVYEILQ